MNTFNFDFQELVRRELIEANPLANLILACLTKVFENPRFSRERKLSFVVAYRIPFSLAHYCLLELKTMGLVSDTDYTYMLLQLHNWYKSTSYVA